MSRKLNDLFYTFSMAFYLSERRMVTQRMRYFTEKVGISISDLYNNTSVYGDSGLITA